MSPSVSRLFFGGREQQSTMTMTTAAERRFLVLLLSSLICSCTSFGPTVVCSSKLGRARAFRGVGASNNSETGNNNDEITTTGSSRTGTDTPDEPPVSSFESMVRSVTGKSDYRFGDLTRTAVSSTTHAFEDVAKATHLVDDDYHFGDITKGAISSISKPVASALSGAEHTLSLARHADIHEFVALSNVLWKDNLTEKQREQTWVVGIHLAAVMVLAYNFISNLQAGIVATVAWTKTSLLTTTTPLAAGNWARFLQIQSTYNMFVGAPFLPVRAIITIKWFFPYRRLLVRLQKQSPLEERYPIMNRVVCVLGMWLVVNLGLVGVLTTGMIWLSSLFTGVPVFPAT